MAITVRITVVPTDDDGVTLPEHQITDRMIPHVTFLAVELDAVQITHSGRHETIPVKPGQSVAVNLVIA